MTVVALVTFRGFPSLTDDDRILAAALERRGVTAVPAIWDDPEVDWAAFPAVVIRSPWDYFLRIDEFRAWLDRLEHAAVRVENPIAVMRWNLEKTYLLDLAARGVATVPTRVVAKPAKLANLLEEEGWDEAVVKPAVSASSFGTWRTSRGAAAGRQGDLEALLARGKVLVQRFVPEIADGEWSLCFIGGRLSHAVRKVPAAGEFRVQRAHGGEVVVAAPPAAIVADAETALAAVPGRTLYARVDGCDVGGRLCLMELEAIEPELFFRVDALAADRFADALLP